MKIGIKMGDWTPKENVIALAEDADFFELYGKYGVDFSYLKGLNKPVIIHVPHFHDKFNISNPKIKDHNAKLLNNSIRLADEFNSKKIVFHTGPKEDEDCTVQNAIDFIKDNFDSRLLVENVNSSLKELENFGATPDQINHIMSNAGTGFCLDFCHATEQAINTKKDYKAVIQDFLKLNPAHFHLNDSLMQGTGEHLHLGEGKLDLDFIKRIIPKNAELALETPSDFEKQRNEILFLKNNN